VKRPAEPGAGGVLSSPEDPKVAAFSEAGVARLIKTATDLFSKENNTEALTHLSEAVARYPHDDVLATKHADALRLNSQFGKAVAEYRRALGLDETNFDAWYGLGLADYELGADGEAAESFRRALALTANVSAVHLELGKALFYLGEIDAALDHIRQAAETPDPELRRRAIGTIACIVPGSPRATNASILEDRRVWAQIEAAREGPPNPSIQRPHAPQGKLRLGYCSKFFHTRNWMKPVWGVINHHDRSAFEIHLFSDGLPPSAESGYQADPLDHVHDIRDLSNADVASLVTRTGIDILVDLNGYSFQRRLGFLMRRPAPVNVGWFNMYATSGIDAFDYIVGDAVVIPTAEEQFYCERVLRVPGSYLAYSVLYPVPDVAPPPCLAAGFITFASLCSQYKINDEVIEAWAMILRQAPEARLLIKNAALGDSTNRAALHERFGRWEIPPTRVLLEGPAKHEAFLAAYERVDIALDTFPYNGGTTTMEALWQGVPVLTFNGDRWASRQSRSLLLAAGLDDWVMPDRDAYIARAVTLARSPTTAVELASLRATLRERLARSPVCDSAGLCRALEGIYRQVAKRKI
jgi:tetratricopeptide (TPR) repeat protein